MSSDSDRGLNADGFEVLLRALDPDRDRAGALYEELRERIAGLLRWWGSSNPDDLADRTLDRVARKLVEGTEIPPGSLGPYVRGVARMIFYESRRERLEPLADHDLPTAGTEESAETALRCLDRCLAELPKADRLLALHYYGSGAENRRRIAGNLKISMNALRLRTLRLRSRLEECVTACLERE